MRNFKIEDILREAQCSENDKEIIKEAYDFAYEKHCNQKRKSGEPYIIHPLFVSYVVSKMGLDVVTISAALLHDVIEDTTATYDDVYQKFGEEIAGVVEGVTKLKKSFLTNEQMKEDILAANAEDFAAVESNINGQIKLYQDNNAAIQSMMAQEPAKSEEYNTYMASNNEQIEALQQLLIQTQKQGEQEISSAIAELDNKIKTLKQQQRDLTAELAQYVQDSLPETADSAAYLEAAADSVFIPADASEDVEAMDKIRRARQLERRNQAISAFETLAILRQELEPLAEEAAEMKAAASAADSASGNIGLNTAIKTSVIKSFFNYAKQQATVLKRETAREYAASVAYKRAEPDRDISTFNLDDYKFELPEGVKGCADVNK